MTSGTNAGTRESRWIEPVSLRGTTVELRPLMRGDAGALRARDGRGEMPFVVIHRESGTIVGSTRYCNVDPDNRRLEIGNTWYSESYQRTAVNTECRCLLLSHAFGELDAIAVELRTHRLNHRSRRAIERLGTKQDGVLRNHRIIPDGSLGDTVVYSIIESEWPAVRAGLEFALRG